MMTGEGMVSLEKGLENRILLADDEDLFLQSTADLLREEGYHCDTVTNSDDGFQALRTSPYDLLIADINMPGNTNLEFVSKGRNCFPDLPIFLVTGYPELETAVAGIEIRISDYLLKPLELDSLIEKVDRFLSPDRKILESNRPEVQSLEPNFSPFYKRVLDSNGRILSIDPRFAKLLGYPVAALIHRELVDLSEVPVFPISKEHDSISVLEMKFIKRDGQIVDAMAIRRSGVKDYDANCITEEFIVDITHLRGKKKEVTLDQTLETASLIAGGFAHDLNNMLNVIDGYLLLSQEAIDPTHRTQEYFDESRKAIDRASRLTGDLLKFSKTGQIAEPETVDIGRVLVELESLSQVLLSPGAELVVSAPSELPYLLGAPDALFDSLFNLVGNSVDSLSSAGGIVHVHVEIVTKKRGDHQAPHEGAPGQYVSIEVLDNGQGISEEDLLKVPHPFYTTKREEGGTGLGLAIVFRTVKEMGGTVDIRSVAGLGTAVSLLFPIESPANTSKPKGAPE